MTKAFHDQGLKVYIDVVYNHTGEGDVNRDATRLISFRGLDAPVYYELATDARFYLNNNGAGANLNTANPVVRNLVIDSLTYWKDALGVDGFRFDLAPMLGNTCERGCFNFDRFTHGSALNRAVRELPLRGPAGGDGVDLIAEPWTMADYELGKFPSGWTEWNNQYRDAIRRSQNKSAAADVSPAELAKRLSGSPGTFTETGRKPWNSVNFIVTHDGFCLRDVYSFNQQRNDQPWPLGPSPGGVRENISWDQGAIPRPSVKRPAPVLPS